MVLTFKSLYTLGTRYLKDPLHCYLPSHALCSMEEVILAVSSAKEIWVAGTRKTAFAAIAPHLWNFLSREANLAQFCPVGSRKIGVDGPLGG